MTSCDYTRPLHTLNIESSEVGHFDEIRESSAQKDLIENVSTSHRLFDDPIEKDNYQLCEKETSSGVDISIKEVPGYLKANVNENGCDTDSPEYMTTTKTRMIPDVCYHHQNEEGDILSTQNDTKKATSGHKEFDDNTDMLAAEANPTSKWIFMKDPLFIAFLLNIAFGLGLYFSFFLLLVDFAKTMGHGEGEKTGVFFIFLTLFSSLVSRVLGGVANLHPSCHSITIMTVSSFVACISLAFIGHVTNYNIIVFLIALHGAGLGGLLGIYPKVALDIESVDARSYPLALGVVSSVEGVVDICVPVLIGHVVDLTGSYVIPVTCISVITFVSTLALLLVFLRSRKHANKK